MGESLFDKQQQDVRTYVGKLNESYRWDGGGTRWTVECHFSLISFSFFLLKTSFPFSYNFKITLIFVSEAKLIITPLLPGWTGLGWAGPEFIKCSRQ